MESSNKPPSSPGPGPVRLSECIEDLLRFTLAATADDNDDEFLAVDVGLSADYCGQLLREEPFPIPTGISGVPNHPLYKHLARAMEQCISSRRIHRFQNTMGEIAVSESSTMKENEWAQLIADKGSELVKMFESVGFELHVQEPFFSQLRAGLKTIEGRCALGDYNRIAPGALLLFNKCLLLEVQHVRWYSSFSEMLQMETLAKVLPGIETIEEGVQIYRKFYTAEKEQSNGVVAISVSKRPLQPYLTMADILKVLSYDGLGCLLGMTHTIGTITSAPPPARSVLTESAMKIYQPNIQGCSLSVAARALAKHVGRSGEGWWGHVSGSDSDKNKLALEVIERLLSCCTWMNVHVIQPFGCVFEIRVPEGYGARWSRDGSEFIGFLEPYSKEGYSRGWKH